jgi:hypothetical protein
VHKSKGNVSNELTGIIKKSEAGSLRCRVKDSLPAKAIFAFVRRRLFGGSTWPVEPDIIEKQKRLRVKT